MWARGTVRPLKPPQAAGAPPAGANPAIPPATALPAAAQPHSIGDHLACEAAAAALVQGAYAASGGANANASVATALNDLRTAIMMPMAARGPHAATAAGLPPFAASGGGGFQAGAFPLGFPPESQLVNGMGAQPLQSGIPVPSLPLHAASAGGRPAAAAAAAKRDSVAGKIAMAPAPDAGTKPAAPWYDVLQVRAAASLRCDGAGRPHPSHNDESDEPASCLKVSHLQASRCIPSRLQLAAYSLNTTLWKHATRLLTEV